MIGKTSKINTFNLASNTSGDNMMADSLMRRGETKDRSNASLILQEQLEISKRQNFINAG